jgi:hypothetical protein
MPNVGAVIEDDTFNNLPRQVRFRPVYLDHKQWFNRDPKIDREIKKAEEMRARLTQAYGASVIEKGKSDEFISIASLQLS